MTPAGRRKSLAELTTDLGPTPELPVHPVTEADQPAPAAPERSQPRKTRTAPPAEPTRGKWDRRIPFTTDATQDQALKQARLDDSIQATARLRAMVALWMTDERHRARVDKLARQYR